MKSFHSPLDPLALDQFLVKIREVAPRSEIHANPFLYLVKPTEENLSKYKFSRPESRIRLGIELFLFLPLILTQILVSLVFSFWFLSQDKLWKLDQKLDIKYFILTHYTFAQDPCKQDIFFGRNLNLPRSLVLYLNHTRKSMKNILKSFLSVGKRNVLIMPKTLAPLDTLVLQLIQLRTSIWLFTKAFKGANLKVTQRRMLIRAAIFQHKRETMANLVLRERVNKILTEVNPKFIILTLEGHAHESMIIRLRNEFFQSTRIVGYQHAPIVSSQLNLFRSVSVLREDDCLLTTGESSKKLMLTKNSRCTVAVLGSTKARKYEFQEKDSWRISVLLAPEGTRESLSQFILISNMLSSLFPEVTFKIRPHPSLGRISKSLIRAQLQKRYNVNVSDSSLNEDLRLANIVLFRSSAIGIEGLSRGVVPVHVNLEGTGSSLNPLFCTNLDNISFNNLLDLKNYIHSFDLTYYASEISQREFYKHFSDYFEELRDINLLID